MQADPRPLSCSMSRRRLLQLSALAGLGLVGGCGRGSGAQLVYGRGELPAVWAKRLPDPWRAQAVEGPEAVLSARAAALVQLGDGWLEATDADAWQPFVSAGSPASTELWEGLAPEAQPLTRLFRPEPAPALAYPWSFGTWLLVLRNRRDLVARAAEGWALLLDPSLRGQLLLPSSPRLVIDLALRQLGLPPGVPASVSDPRLGDQLSRLRRQAAAFDDRDGLNLLLSGEVEAAVLPSQRVLPLLRSDTRLSALLPASGSALWWNLLLRPAQTREVPPLRWLLQAREAPLLNRLLAAGWVPPLRRDLLAAALSSWPPAVAALLYPAPALLARCTSLPPLAEEQRPELQSLWDRSGS
ncbi:hypothetical protein KBY93_04385 [Synechococcus sp. J7-Johnson]|uniref:hypothetical protein n=1 Tax=Synechococcus sp. J7-Johnson TaxID=2823737 RepID=UPI0020CF5C5E|nr:hypothetical protein [Synechococcus sp. J7-Johnson]MCP9839872.1 hypothetical protein [Synechococcus sp. J7-Johnson]